MKKGLLVALLCMMSVLGFANEPSNLMKAKERVVQYVKSGEYKRQLTNVYHDARLYLKMRIAKHKAQKEQKQLAVVLDLDETLLSNYPHMEHFGFGGDKQLIEDYIAKGDDPVLPSAFRFVQFAQKHDVAVFFVTGRSESYRVATEKNLHKVGVNHWKHLYMRPDSYHAGSIVPFKTAMRAAIEKQGYVVVESIGDQWSDIKGGHVEKGYKLPNPFYLIP